MVFAIFSRFSRRNKQIELRKRLDTLWTGGKRVFYRIAAVPVEDLSIFRKLYSKRH